MNRAATFATPRPAVNDDKPAFHRWRYQIGGCLYYCQTVRCCV